MKGEIVLLSFVWNGNDALIKQKALAMCFAKSCSLWDTTKHKTPMFYSLFIHTWKFYCTMKPNVSQDNPTAFPLSSPVIIQSNNQLGVKFDPLFPQHNL